MRSLLWTLFLLLGDVAAAGGSGSPTPLAMGQVWELKATQKGGLKVTVEMHLFRNISQLLPRIAIPMDAYAAESVLGASNINFILKENVLESSLMMSEDTTLHCFANYNPTSGLATGYLLQGTLEVTSQQLAKAHSHAALVESVRRLGMGTCTLRRVR